MGHHVERIFVVLGPTVGNDRRESVVHVRNSNACRMRIDFQRYISLRWIGRVYSARCKVSSRDVNVSRKRSADRISPTPQPKDSNTKKHRGVKFFVPWPATVTRQKTYAIRGPSQNYQQYAKTEVRRSPVKRWPDGRSFDRFFRAIRLLGTG